MPIAGQLDAVCEARAKILHGPLDRALAFLDPLLARPALVVEGDDPRGRSGHVGDDEADARIKLARVLLDLGNHAARCLPTLRLIAEIGVVPSNLARRTTNRALEQISDPLLKNLIGRQPDRVLVAFGLLELVDPVSYTH